MKNIEPVQRAGVVIYRDWGTQVRYCLITARDPTCYGLPQGHIEPGETPAEAAIREHITTEDQTKLVDEYLEKVVA